MKYLLGIIFFISFSSFAKTSCEDPNSCLPTVQDKTFCINYILDVTNASSENDLQDIARVCDRNFGDSCVKYVTKVLKRTDFNSVIDNAKACEANYSSKCVDTLVGASWTKNRNTILDFTKACMQNVGNSCVKRSIEEEGRIDHWSLRSYARNCQVYNKELNRQR